ncbi:MAG TPA: FAD-dependent monooxygenase [Phycisphaerae bacterium]|nr:FAD-dependent monooxygenase [Phycisphaerae bacterium]HOJ75153.1 FAD-dependent monooxygenase [Phycisphaerae bacterium]HOM52383.1 FAD-dependent monooxygenase [Phycisphaerae bacterium]HON66251.1 FAD-dependent monooxygenase [Phycisphaerae bacterium]HOQ85168.1 FAD-dependent monooxygenase [Phycisphaerae bacterium]
MTQTILIVGAGTTGTTAAILLARRGYKPVLIERSAKTNRKQHAPDWICRRGVELLGELGIDCAAKLGDAYDGLTFHSSDLTKTAQSAATTPPAWRIDYPQFTAHLHQLAREAGIEIVHSSPARRIELREEQVCVELEEGDPLEGSFLLLADGAGRTLCSPGGHPAVLSSVSPKTPGRWFATLELPAPSRGRDPRDGHLHWLLGLDRQQACCLWWWEGSTVIVSLFAAGTGDSVNKLLCATANKLVGAGLIASKDAIDPAAVMLRPAPARSALEIDSHVNKRCLVIGDAGGFIGEISGQGIFAGVWSARIAVDAVIAAASSVHPQDQLRDFSTTWRSDMADYLRPPNTDMHFLLPLIFSNRQMADRMAAAFWEGQNI